MHDGDNRETPQNDGVEPTGLPGTPTPNFDDENRRDSGYPEPPQSWNTDSDSHLANANPPNRVDLPSQNAGLAGKTVVKMSSDEVREFEKGRKFSSAAQITALVSLFIGGVALSAVSMVLAIIGFRSLSRVADRQSSEPSAQNAIRRLGVVAIIMSVLSLVVNVVSLIVFYPMLVEMLQQGNLSGILPGGGQAAPGGSGNAPGTSLFG